MIYDHRQELIALEHAAIAMVGAVAMIIAPTLANVAIAAIVLNHLVWGVRLALCA